jgi:hypothetical protein
LGADGFALVGVEPAGSVLKRRTRDGAAELRHEPLRLLERHVVRRMLEGDELLRGRLERFEIRRCLRRVDVPVVTADEEDDRHRDARQLALEIAFEELGGHRIERDPVGANEARDLPGRHETGQHAEEQRREAIRPPVEHAAIALGDSVDREDGGSGPMRRRSERR